MAQLNPNFEIDFNDINSYEQIQLINDTQLAKENLLMHRAYKEPADDAIIRNQFSSFTFVDFCPKLFTLKQQAANSSSSTIHQPPPSSQSTTIRHYELETFSDLFERINVWLKLNKDWRVVSMETLVFDCTSQFNHLKSSIHANYLPKNTRGLRLFLSPSKSRFSGPQKVGCINVVPRKVSGSHLRPEQPIEYETLEQILARLNELLLTRPIEGRILSVETITLPMVNGYVNTETNYFMDNRLNLLNQRIYSLADVSRVASSNGNPQEQQTDNNKHSGHTLIDILRVYYEFGPMVCGLVNLIDFVPRFYSTVDVNEQNQPQKSEATSSSSSSSPSPSGPANQQQSEEDGGNQQAEQQKAAAPFVVGTNPKITATESMTRLIRRSLSWFEAERERVLNEECPAGHDCDAKLIVPNDDDDDGEIRTESSSSSSSQPPPRSQRTRLNLKVCNLQIHSKLMLKNELIQVKPANALDRINTKQMIHQKRRKVGADQPAIVCHLCEAAATSHSKAGQLFTMNTSLPTSEWCAHLIDLSEPYELRFVRLAYIIPVNQTKSRINTCPLALNRMGAIKPAVATRRKNSNSTRSEENNEDQLPSSGSSSSTTSNSSSGSSSSASSPGATRLSRRRSVGNSKSSLGEDDDDDDEDQDEEEDEEEPDEEEEEDNDEVKFVEKLLAQEDSEEFSKQCALESIRQTNSLHRHMELAHQLKIDSTSDYDCSPIGQLTYRLFAPCQLVNSSSCFAINPVNSSNPLARRGSVDLNGPGNSTGSQPRTVGCLSSENANPASLLLPSSSGHQHHHHQQIVSFGAFFPALTSHDLISASTSDHHANKNSSSSASTTNSKFTTNEFESVEAIRRRMEIYVTTNSMKVLAGETLIINLSDHLSCLSTAIEQTVVRASFGQRAPSTWVSVYILYAAVEEPAKQLLEHQKRLAKISEEETNGEQAAEEQREQGQDQMVPVFDDDFKSIEELKKYQQQQSAAKSTAPSATPANNNSDHHPKQDPPPPTIRIEQNPCDSSLTLYNSAYDRTVALPTQPDNHLSHYLEPNEFLGAQDDCIWLDENDLIEAHQQQANQQEQQQQSAYQFKTIDSSATPKQTKQQRDSLRQRGKTYRKIGSKSLGKRKLGRSRNDSQCSVM